MAVVLDQPLRAGVRLMNLALRAIAREEPVVAQCSCVLLFRDPDAFGCLLSEALQLSGSNCQVGEDLKGHYSSFKPHDPKTLDCRIASLLEIRDAISGNRRLSQPQPARKGPNEHGLAASEDLLGRHTNAERSAMRENLLPCQNDQGEQEVPN